MSTRPRPKIQLLPINWVQRIALYVTDSRCYLVGSNNTQTAFKVLKIDRTEKDLSLVDDRVEYTYQEIRDLLIRLDQGNKKSADSPGLSKTISSFGLLGFVRFLHGYYLILIIKRRKVALIGYHTIYKVEDTKLVYIPNRPPTEFISEETKYVRAFCNIDLTSNFYFSYSYDITHSLQYNLSPVRGSRFFQEYWQKQRAPERKRQDTSDNKTHNAPSTPTSDDATIKEKEDKILVRSKPALRFVWNSHLIDFAGLHDDWKIYLIHGFVAQANICVYSKPIYVTLIARRSNCYSGTRFLKRGLNLNGDVANEVETEQIVHDASVSDCTGGFYTSFVQMRGSMPDRWSQDVTKIVAKPQIVQDYIDPYHEASGRHFNDLLGRYGSPVVVLNLVKKQEKRPHESILNNMLNSSVSYLNQFLPQHHMIRTIAFDMARCSKSRNKNVMQRLGKIGFNIVRVTGIFQNWQSSKRSNSDNTYTLHLRQQTFTRRPSSSKIGGYRLRSGLCLQNGVVRVNCVDSLDRTNTAQFVLGKVALGFQLQALGVLMEPNLEYDTDAVRLLEQLYEDHGDTIALQYGGSQLVHRVKTYRKVAPLTSHSSEIMQTLSRYYSNTFSDAEKQSVINLFLGVRKALPTNAQSILSNLATDYYLHNELLLEPFSLELHRNNANYRQWWNRKYLRSLPRAYNEHEKESACYALELRDDSMTTNERVNYFFDAYRPFELSYLTSSFSHQILNTVRDYMPSGSVNYSPFCLRLGPGKLKEIYLKKSSKSSKKLPPNPSIHGIPSSPSSASSEVSSLVSDDDDDDDDDVVDDGDYEATETGRTSRRDSTTLHDLSTHPTTINNSSFLLSNSTDLQRVEHTEYSLMRFLQDNREFYRSTNSRHGHEPDCESSGLFSGSNNDESADQIDSYMPRSLVKEDVELYENYVKMVTKSDGMLSLDSHVNKYQQVLERSETSLYEMERLMPKINQDYEQYFGQQLAMFAPKDSEIKFYSTYLSGRSFVTPVASPS